MWSSHLYSDTVLQESARADAAAKAAGKRELTNTDVFLLEKSNQHYTPTADLQELQQRSDGEGSGQKKLLCFYWRGLVWPLWQTMSSKTIGSSLCKIDSLVGPCVQRRVRDAVSEHGFTKGFTNYSQKSERGINTSQAALFDHLQMEFTDLTPCKGKEALFGNCFLNGLRFSHS